jgi:hypothetical protein
MNELCRRVKIIDKDRVISLAVSKRNVQREKTRLYKTSGHSKPFPSLERELTYSHCPRCPSFIRHRMAKPKPGAKSASKDLVKLGPREVFVEADKAQKLREVKPTTSRALVLRNGKYGVQARGDLSLMSKISGREKLDLLAGELTVTPFTSLSITVSTEDLVDRTSKAVAAPFDIEKCLRIAESQYDGEPLLLPRPLVSNLPPSLFGGHIQSS